MINHFWLIGYTVVFDCKWVPYTVNVLALVILYFDITLGLNRIFNDDYFTAQLIVIFTMYGNIQALKHLQYTPDTKFRN
jgi:hypothetical protein